MRSISSSVRFASLTLLACASLWPHQAEAAARAGARQVSRQKNVELNSVAQNMGNYDSPPVTPPRTFALPGYEQCLVALGCTYCRSGGARWTEVFCE